MLYISYSLVSNSFKRGLNVDYAFISGLLATFSALAGLLFAILTVRKMNKKLETFEELGQNVGQLFRYEEDEEGQPLLDARIGKMITLFSSSVAKSLKMSMLGSLSGPARLEKGLKGAIASDVVQKQMPILGLIGDVMGINTQKYVSKHPDALMQLAARFAPQLANLKLGSNPTHGNDGVGYG